MSHVLLERVDVVPIYDTHEFLMPGSSGSEITLIDEGVSIHLQPLQSVVVKLLFRNN